MKLSDMSLEELKGTHWLHNINPEKLESLEDFTAWLEAILHNPCNIWEEEGEMFLIETRELVARVNGLKIEIYSNEHPPPHFHVKSPNLNASFSIESCQLLQGKVEPRDKKKIRYWHKHAKPLLIEAWNSTRPTNCSVGLYTAS